MRHFTYLSSFLISFLVSSFLPGGQADICAREWLQYQGNCYGYFDTKMTWPEAEIECQSYRRGAHLASLLSHAEILVVANHISAYQTEVSDVWIGLHDIRHNGRWRWSDESTYNYKAWMMGALNNLETNEYCVELKHSVAGTPAPVLGILEQREIRDRHLNLLRRNCLSEERLRNEPTDFTQWSDAKCHKLNAYICKHEL
ncbi:C-type lectin-like [Anolis carolinensis]|uniref:C-type lectin-like n=1 Tax=Anolis carolinensis TaxID=28377 RepID=UPI002F2B3AA8